MLVEILIDTDYPNADGIATVAARELFERFTPKPRHRATVTVIAENDANPDGMFRTVGPIRHQEGRS